MLPHLINAGVFYCGIEQDWTVIVTCLWVDNEQAGDAERDVNRTGNVQDTRIAVGFILFYFYFYNFISILARAKYSERTS